MAAATPKWLVLGERQPGWEIDSAPHWSACGAIISCQFGGYAYGYRRSTAGCHDPVSGNPVHTNFFQHKDSGHGCRKVLGNSLADGRSNAGARAYAPSNNNAVGNHALV